MNTPLFSEFNWIDSKFKWQPLMKVTRKRKGERERKKSHEQNEMERARITPPLICNLIYMEFSMINNWTVNAVHLKKTLNLGPGFEFLVIKKSSIILVFVRSLVRFVSLINFKHERNRSHFVSCLDNNIG